MFFSIKCLHSSILLYILICICHRLYTPNHLSIEDKSIGGIKTARNQLKTDGIQNVIDNAHKLHNRAI